jgi:2-amino-4-hydroxy-6-hydroxymethyldihydropteridine diphosphokinase
MRAYVGLGANIGDREQTIQAALARLEATEGVTVTAASSLIETEPVGYLDQPWFLNGAAAVETSLTPQQLLDLLLDTERALGRTREGHRYGPRVIDLDLLVIEGIVVDEPGLVVPHPRVHERLFALVPLGEIAPSLVIQGRGPVAELVAGFQADDGAGPVSTSPTTPLTHSKPLDS